MANDYIIKIEGSWPSGETEYVIGTEDPQRLPVVSSDDNGDVLTVVDGKWSDAAPGGGGGGGGGLPPVTSDDNGNFLGVNNGEWGKVGGYSVTETTETVVAEQTVTTVQAGNVYFSQIAVSVDNIAPTTKCVVSFNGVDYALDASVSPDNTSIVVLGETQNGAPDFTNYPFYLDISDHIIATASASTITVKVIANEYAISTSKPFETAIDKALCVHVSWDDDAGAYVADVPHADVLSKIIADIPVIAVIGALDGGWAPPAFIGYRNGSIVGWTSVFAASSSALRVCNFVWDESGITDTYATVTMTPDE